MIAEKTSSEQQVEALRQRAHERLAAQNKSLADIAGANTRLLEAGETWECTGVLTLGADLMRIEDMRFDNGAVLEFDAPAWGLGSSGQGIGVFNVPPSALVAYDKVKVQMSFVPFLFGGVVETSFWSQDTSEYLGCFTAHSTAHGTGSAASVGKFRNA